jgi:hypothetical protein
VAIGRALMARPKLLCMDEPSMGLSPAYVDQVFDIIRTINRQGTTIFMVEQNANMALRIANRAYVLQTGRIVLSGPAAELRETELIRRAYLGELTVPEPAEGVGSKVPDSDAPPLDCRTSSRSVRLPANQLDLDSYGSCHPSPRAIRRQGSDVEPVRKREAGAVAKRQSRPAGGGEYQAGCEREFLIQRHAQKRQRFKHQPNFGLWRANACKVTDDFTEIDCRHRALGENGPNFFSARLIENERQQGGGVQNRCCHSRSASRRRSARNAPTEASGLPAVSLRANACAWAMTSSIVLMRISRPLSSITTSPPRSIPIAFRKLAGILKRPDCETLARTDFMAHLRWCRFS